MARNRSTPVGSGVCAASWSSCAIALSRRPLAASSCADSKDGLTSTADEVSLGGACAWPGRIVIKKIIAAIEARNITVLTLQFNSARQVHRSVCAENDLALQIVR